MRSDTIKGIIYKILSGNYYVDADGKSYVCRARGLFRLEKITPLVGDYVEIDIDQFEEDKAYIVKILERKNQLIRPAVANIEQAIIVIALMQPKPNMYLLDKMILMSELADVKPIIVINKIDLDSDDIVEEYLAIYRQSGYQIFLTSAENGSNIDGLRAVLKDSVSVFCGASGVGKSSLLNALLPKLNLKIGGISKKTERGKHTTRHSELIKLDFGGYVLDTPGFTSLELRDIDANELADYFPEFDNYREHCKFNNCRHINEHSCAVKKALENGEIVENRYRSYCMMSKELEQIRSY